MTTDTKVPNIEATESLSGSGGVGVEKTKVVPEEERRIIASLTGFFGLDMHAFSPKKVFDLCTTDDHYPLLNDFSLLTTDEARENFLKKNPQINQLVADLKVLLNQHKKEEEVSKDKEWVEGRKDFYRNYLPNMKSPQEPFFGVTNGIDFIESMMDELIIWEKKYVCDMSQKFETPQYYKNVQGFFKKNYERVESKEGVVETREKRNIRIYSVLLDLNFFDCADDLSDEEKKHLVLLIIKKDSEGTDFFETLEVANGKTNVRIFLTQHLTDYRAKKALQAEIDSDPEARKTKIRDHLLQTNYWDMEKTIGAGFFTENPEYFDFLVEELFLFEKFEGKSVLQPSKNEKFRRLFFMKKLIDKEEKEVMAMEKSVMGLSQSFNAVDEKNENLDEKVVVETKKAEKVQAQALFKKQKNELMQDEQYKNNPRLLLEKLRIIAKGEVYKERREMIDKTLALLAFSAEHGNEADQAVVSQIVYRNLFTTDMSEGFNTSLSAIVNSDEVSDGLKTQICEKFKIHKPEKTTGSEVKASLERGFRTDENGQRVPYTKEQPLALTENVTAYESEKDSDYILDLDLGDWRNIKLKVPSNLTGEELGKHIYIAQMVYALEKMGGMGEFIFGRDLNILHEGPLTIHQGDFIKAKKVGKYFLHSFSGENGEILDEGHMAQLKHSFQWLHKKGDYAEDDVTPDIVQVNLKELGILDKDGTLNQKQFEKAGDFIQRNYRTGAPDFGTLKSYLNVDNALEMDMQENELINTPQGIDLDRQLENELGIV